MSPAHDPLAIERERAGRLPARAGRMSVADPLAREPGDRAERPAAEEVRYAGLAEPPRRIGPAALIAHHVYARAASDASTPTVRGIGRRVAHSEPLHPGVRRGAVSHRAQRRLG